jgi:hypothetical protein
MCGSGELILPSNEMQVSNNTNTNSRSQKNMTSSMDLKLRFKEGISNASNFVNLFLIM